MPNIVHPKQALHLEGIHLAPGPLFSSPEMGMRVYGLFFGPDYAQAVADKDTLRNRATGVLSDIFALCLARVGTFTALHDSNLSWQVVAGDMAEQYRCIMTASEVEELVTVFSNARRKFLSLPRAAALTSPSTKLTTLIDRWLDAIGPEPQISSQPAPSLLLPVRSAPVESLLASFSLLVPSSSPAAAAAANTSQNWPPSHLPTADVDFLKHGKIREHLGGVCWAAKGAMPVLPAEQSDPLALRLFVGWLAAAHTPPPPTNTFALFAAPVAFMNNKARQDWFRPSGYQSKMFGHVEGFLEYADGTGPVHPLFCDAPGSPESRSWSCRGQ